MKKNDGDDDDRMDVEEDKPERRDFYAEFWHDMDALNGDDSSVTCFLQPVSPDYSVPNLRVNKQIVDAVKDLFPPSQVTALVQGRFVGIKRDTISAVAVDTFLPFPCSPSPVMALWRAVYGTCNEEFSWQTCELMSLQNLLLFCSCENIERLLPAFQNLPGGRKFLLKDAYKRLCLRQQQLHAEALDKFYARDDRSPAAMDDFMRILWVHGLQCARMKEWFIMHMFGIDDDDSVRLALYSPDVKVPFAALSEAKRQRLMTDFVNLMRFRKRAFGTEQEPLTFVDDAMRSSKIVLGSGDQWYDRGWMTYSQCVAYARYLKVE